MNTPEATSIAAAVGAYLLNMPVRDVFSDPRRWAILHKDDGFFDACFAHIDWRAGTLPAELRQGHRASEHHWLWARRDFDLHRSIIDWDGFDPEENGALPLEGFFVDASVYGAQLAQLIDAELVSPGDMADVTVFGRVRSTGETLVEALAALLMLDEYPERTMPRHAHALTETEHQGFIATLPQAAQDHVSMFFQDEHAARSGGATTYPLEDPPTLAMFGQEAYRIHCAWLVGEGEGQFALVEILNDTVAPVPI